MYFSGSMTHPDVVERLTSTGVHRLFTFAAPKEVHEYLRYCDQRGIRGRIMIDSGAFTSWNIGRPVDLQQLIAYDLELLRLYPQHQFVFIALDVIPGSRGVAATQVDINNAVERSYSNFRVMLQALPGQTVLPVYHSGEDRFIRDRYLGHVPYMCLSMNQNLSEGQRLQWAREAMVPGYYFHGLAATGNAMLSQVDWYSVDSSGWLMVAAMGSILFPIGNKLRPLSVSNTAPGIKDAGKHITNMHEAPWIEQYIRSKGYDPVKLSTDYAARICWNIDQWNSPPWIKDVVQPEGLFK